MRNRLVHGYFDINLEVLWRTVQDDLALLIVAIEDGLVLASEAYASPLIWKYPATSFFAVS